MLKLRQLYYYTSLFKDEDHIIKHLPEWKQLSTIVKKILQKPTNGVGTDENTLAMIEMAGNYPINILEAVFE